MSFTATIKSSFGFLATLITRYTPLDLSRDSVEGIFNFIQIREGLLTSGQPTEAQLALVRDAGVRHVINLAPHHAENALADEAGTLTALDMDYTHIPVNFQAPTDADFEAFCRAMQTVSDENVLVHCAANMRVSAFIYRYRRDILQEQHQLIRPDMERIWEPFGIWKQFIAAPSSEANPS
jgi:protein tyrosine phosphatase (PTP) superfamily phosphohydrolase (DUF442 family)